MKKVALTAGLILSILTFKASANKFDVKSVKDTKYSNVISITIEQNKLDTVYLSLVDTDGNTFYTERIVGTTINRKFSLLVPNEYLNDTITVLIESKRTGKIDEYKFVPNDVLVK